jgi:hypothetical protein
MARMDAFRRSPTAGLRPPAEEHAALAIGGAAEFAARTGQLLVQRVLEFGAHRQDGTGLEDGQRAPY